MALLSIFRGTQAECSARPVSDGTLLFATDTKKIYLDKDSSRIEMSSVDDLGNYVTKEQLTMALNGKANTTHTHTQDQITGLKDALAGKASTSHSHSVASGSASGFMSAADKQKLDGIATGANKYTLPVASSTALGGVKIGYKESGKNYSVKLDNNNQAYVTVPWTDTTSKDTNTTYTLTKNGSTITLEGSDGSSTAVHDDNTTYSLGSFGVNASATELNYVKGVTSSIQTQLNSKANSSHTHTKSQITDFPSSLKNPNSLTISLNGTSQGAYDGSSTKSINVTPSSIGAATSGHTHNYAGADSAGGAAKEVKNWGNASENVARHVWFSNNGADNQRVYNDNFKYNPVGNTVSCNISGTANVANYLNGTVRYVTKNSVDKPYWRCLKLESAQDWFDSSIILCVDAGYENGGFGILAVRFRNDNVSGSNVPTHGTVQWLCRYGYEPDQFILKIHSAKATTGYADLYFHATGTYNSCNIRILANSIRGYNGSSWQLMNDEPRAAMDTRAYTAQATGCDVGKVAYASSAGSANSVPWGGVSDKPSSMKNPNSLTISLNGTSQGAYDGSAAKSINVTPASIGAAASSHNHDASNITSGTLSADRIPTITDGKIQSVSASKITGTIPQSILPSYVDDVLEYKNLAAFPKTGESGKIYVADDTNKTYRWSGTAYVEISASLALGTTSSTAFRGDYGNTAYAHAQAKGSAFSSGLYKITTNSQGHVTAATAVTKSDITALGIPGSDTNTNTTYSLSKSGSTITLKGSDGSTTSVTDADTNTTYSTFKGATTSAAGGTGLVPAPATGAANRYLRSDGTWQVPPDNNTTYSNMGGASSNAAGHAGLVPAPAAGASNRYLRSDGTWSVPPDNNTNTTYSLSKNGSTITLTGSDGSKTSVTDSNTTYSLSSFGINASAAELNYVKGVTSSIQTQLNSKAASSHNHSAANITSGTLSIARGGTGATDTATARSNLGFGFTQLYYNYDQGWVIYASDYMVWIYSYGVAIGSGSWDTKVCPYILPQKYRISKTISHLSAPCVVDNGGSWTGALVVNSDGQIIVKNLGNAGSTDARYGFLCYPVGVL